MKTLKKILACVAFIIPLFFITSCDEDDNKGTIIEDLSGGIVKEDIDGFVSAFGKSMAYVKSKEKRVLQLEVENSLFYYDKVEGRIVNYQFVNNKLGQITVVLEKRVTYDSMVKYFDSQYNRMENIDPSVSVLYDRRKEGIYFGILNSEVQRAIIYATLKNIYN